MHSTNAAVVLLRFAQTMISAILVHTQPYVLRSTYSVLFRVNLDSSVLPCTRTTIFQADSHMKVTACLQQDRASVFWFAILACMGPSERRLCSMIGDDICEVPSTKYNVKTLG